MARMHRWTCYIEKARGADKFWGYIDSQAICCHPGDQRVSSSRHKTHAFTVQYIVTPDGMIASVYGPCAGKVNELVMVRKSGLKNRLRVIWGSFEPENRLFLCGDEAYKGEWGILGPFKPGPHQDVVPELVEHYNPTLTSCRNVVGQGFAIVDNLREFADWMGHQKIRLSPAAAYMVAVGFTNIYNCFRPNQASVWFKRAR
jgi:hypothetical protein